MIVFFETLLLIAFLAVVFFFILFIFYLTAIAPPLKEAAPSLKNGKRDFNYRLSVVKNFFLACFSKHKKSLFYEVVVHATLNTDDKDLFKRTKRYLNVGYWKEAENINDANEEMVRLCSDKCGFSAGDHLLDVGYGYGEQTVFINKNYPLSKITGINISNIQHQHAKKLAEEYCLQDRIEFQVGDALEIHNKFGANIFDKILAIECAHHFEDREVFFQQAHQALKKGGKICLADIVFEKKSGSLLTKLFNRLFKRIWLFSKNNFHDLETYLNKLKQAGFQEVEYELITQDSLASCQRYCLKCIREYEQKNVPSILRFFSFFGKFMSTIYAVGWNYTSAEYIIVTAVK